MNRLAALAPRSSRRSRLVRGDVLEDEPYATWALDLRGSYQGRVLGLISKPPTRPWPSIDFGAALAHAEAAVALDRFSERAQRSEMMALYAVGRTHEALGRYRSFRMRLDEELGLEPTGESRALESAIIRQEDVHSLLPRPILRAEKRYRWTRAPPARPDHRDRDAHTRPCGRRTTGTWR